jgi:hypothetical protein
VAYGPCQDGSQVLVDSIIGQGHQWPSASNGVQADLVWAFFKQYSLSGTTAMRRPESSASRAAFSAGYAAGMIRIDGLEDGIRMEVTDPKGERIATETTKQGRIAFPGRSSGVYMVKVAGTDRASARKIIVP